MLQTAAQARESDTASRVIRCASALRPGTLPTSRDAGYPVVQPVAAPVFRRAAPGETPTTRLKARLNAASDW